MLSRSLALTAAYSYLVRFRLNHFLFFYGITFSFIEHDETTDSRGGGPRRGRASKSHLNTVSEFRPTPE